MRRLTDPRVPGGAYVSGYWRQAYQVEAMWSDVATRAVWLRVRWADGRRTAHATPWDARADSVAA